MDISLDSIGSNGRVVELDLKAAWAAAAVSDVLDGTLQALSVRARFEREGTRVRVAVEGQADAQHACERCGVDLTLTVSCDQLLEYLPEAPTSEEEVELSEVELSEDELDTGHYANESISLEMVLRESFALSMPTRVVCSDVSACDERTAALLDAARDDSPGHPGFAALKKLL